MFLGRVLDWPTAQDLSTMQDPVIVDFESLTEEMIAIELGRVFLMAVICYLLYLLLEKHILLKIASADMIGGWMLYMLKVPKTGVVFFVLYVALIVAEYVRFRLKKMKNRNVQSYILRILPFLILYVVFLYLIPMPTEPYDWQWAKSLYQRAEEKITMYAENMRNGGSEYFGGTTSGFSERGGLFTDITNDDRQLMMLGIGKQKEASVYLTGKIFDAFNGREWENRRDDANTDRRGKRSENRESADESERIMDVLETVYALRRYTGSINPPCYRSIRMDVSYRYFHTNYLMAPSKTWMIEDGTNKIKYHQSGGNFIFDRKAGYGAAYTLQFEQLNMGREELYQFLEWNQGDDADEWHRVVRQYTGRNIPIEKLYEYRDRVKEQYQQETRVSPEVEAWLTVVTAEAKTDADRLKYIESALSDMEYNMTPGELPATVFDESSFLDYFLLEKREGYCVHFATTFVLLARAEGFPVRYVQGFCVPIVRGNETSVYSDMAHAWPEVYIEGKGWIPFEPTPGFGVNRYLPEDENEGNDVETVYTREPEPQIRDDIPALESEVMEESVSDENIMEERERNRWTPYLVRVVWILLIGTVLVLITDWVREKFRDKKRNPVEKYRLAVLHNLQILEMLGYKRMPSETFHELLKRIEQECEDIDKKYDDGQGGNEIPYRFIETYEKYLYGTLEIDEQILNDVLAQGAQLLETLRVRHRRAYLFYRIQLYIVRYR
ncbi:MAG: transglutaminase domain-containing protein [Lachnospiraceae bacterium]|nr:transglutaminase domain-containing protein [Lachnospiraceae bacterium]